MADERMTGDQVAAQDGLEDWRPVLGALRTRFATGDFVTGLDLVTAITAAAEEANHHPDLDLRYPHVDVSLSSHDVGGMTRRDVDLARTISGLAGERGIAADPAAPQELELGLDTWNSAEIGPFWAAVVGADYDHDSDQVADPDGQVPTIWFQQTERHDEPRQRFHLDLWVPTDLATERIRAALAAGGTLVAEEESFTVLADAQGNKVCFCVTTGRSF